MKCSLNIGFIFCLCSLCINCRGIETAENVRYYGTLIYSSPDSIDGNLKRHTLKFQITKNTDYLNSLLTSNLLEVKRSERYVTQSPLYLYGIDSIGDTSCYVFQFSSDKFSILEIYSNCDVGILLKAYKSYALFQFFDEYFKSEYNINLINE